jgi:hypothetical protein
LYLDQEIVVKIKEELHKSNLTYSAHVKNELRRLHALRTQKSNDLETIYLDRLKNVLTVEKYKEFSDKISEDIRIIETQIQDIEKENVSFREEESMLLELLQGVKETYLKQELKGKSDILRIILNRCYLLGKDGNESTWDWAYPFNYLFSIGNMRDEAERGVIKKSMWGE